MPHFRVEVLGKEGKIVETKHIEIRESVVDKALAESKVERLKREAKAQGFGFRVKLIEGEK
jgi:hypothetical protein